MSEQLLPPSPQNISDITGPNPTINGMAAPDALVAHNQLLASLQQNSGEVPGNALGEQQLFAPAPSPLSEAVPAANPPNLGANQVDDAANYITSPLVAVNIGQVALSPAFKYNKKLSIRNRLTTFAGNIAMGASLAVGLPFMAHTWHPGSRRQTPNSTGHVMPPLPAPIPSSPNRRQRPEKIEDRIARYDRAIGQLNGNYDTALDEHNAAYAKKIDSVQGSGKPEDSIRTIYDAAYEADIELDDVMRIQHDEAQQLMSDVRGACVAKMSKRDFLAYSKASEIIGRRGFRGAEEAMKEIRSSESPSLVARAMDSVLLEAIDSLPVYSESANRHNLQDYQKSGEQLIKYASSPQVATAMRNTLDQRRLDMIKEVQYERLQLNHSSVEYTQGQPTSIAYNLPMYSSSDATPANRAIAQSLDRVACDQLYMLFNGKRITHGANGSVRIEATHMTRERILDIVPQIIGSMSGESANAMQAAVNPLIEAQRRAVRNANHAPAANQGNVAGNPLLQQQAEIAALMKRIADALDAQNKP